MTMKFFVLDRRDIGQDINGFITEQVDNARDLISTVREWKVSRERDRHGVECRSTEREGGKWHARISEHNDIPYNTFKKYLLNDHTANESRYIKAISDFSLVEFINPQAQIYRIVYKMPLGVSNRDFTPLILTREAKNEFFVISLAMDHPNAPPDRSNKVVRGYYTSVEYVRQRELGSVEWITATTSTASGYLPDYLTNSLLPMEIAKDVPSFIEYYKQSDF